MKQLILCFIILITCALPSLANGDSTAQRASYIIFNGKGNGAAIEKDPSAINASSERNAEAIKESIPAVAPAEIIPAEENVIVSPVKEIQNEKIKEEAPKKKKRNIFRSFVNVLKGILLFIIYLVMGIGILTGVVGIGMLLSSLLLSLSGSPDEDMQRFGIIALLAGAVAAGGMYLLSDFEFFDEVREDVVAIYEVLGRIFSFPIFY